MAMLTEDNVMNIALITARGGSKGLPRKNIKELNGIPLIAWTIRSALEAECIDMVFVSTDDDEISEVSKSYKARVIPRPAELAKDTTSSEPVIKHAIEYLNEQKINPNNIFLLQPTSPLRNREHIESAYKLYLENKAKCVLSVFEPKHSAAKAYKILDDGSLAGLLFDDAPYCRRQDLPRTLQPNGAIYLFSTEDFMQQEKIPRDNVFPFEMSEKDSSDIDTLEDLIEVEMIMNSENKHD